MDVRIRTPFHTDCPSKRGPMTTTIRQSWPRKGGAGRGSCWCGPGGKTLLQWRASALRAIACAVIPCHAHCPEPPAVYTYRRYRYHADPHRGPYRRPRRRTMIPRSLHGDQNHVVCAGAAGRPALLAGMKRIYKPARTARTALPPTLPPTSTTPLLKSTIHTPCGSET